MIHIILRLMDHCLLLAQDEQERKPNNNLDWDYVFHILKDKSDAKISWLNNDYL